MILPFALASRFVAGETAEEAVPTVKALNASGLHASLDLLGENVTSEKVADEATEAYVNLARLVARERAAGGLDTNISIKLSMLGQRIDRAYCLTNLRRLLEVARETDVFVRLDMEGSDVTDSTLGLFEEVYPEFPDHVGVVLQAYLKRTGEDVRRMCALNARVRLCKGAYKEPPEIAYQDMPTIRKKFIEHMQALITAARYPGIATHDDQLIQATKDFVRENGISLDAFEFQMLYGIRPRKQIEIAREGYHMRVYVPYGTQWLPYFRRRLSERKENVWFVVKNLFRA